MALNRRPGPDEWKKLTDSYMVRRDALRKILDATGPYPNLFRVSEVISPTAKFIPIPGPLHVRSGDNVYLQWIHLDSKETEGDYYECALAGRPIFEKGVIVIPVFTID